MASFDSCPGHHLPRVHSETTTFFLSSEELIHGPRSELSPLRRHVFIQMARNAQLIADFYALPPGRVVEIGRHIEI